MYLAFHSLSSTRLPLCLIFLLLVACGSAQAEDPATASQPIGHALPPGITEVMNDPLYAGTTWSLFVEDLDTGETIYQLDPDRMLLIGSVRKTFSVGFALNELGADHRFETPVHRQGVVDGEGVLDGDLILVASGDLTLGGRTLPDGTVAFTSFDHNEANSLGVATLTEPDPLGGIRMLAAEVAASGVTGVTGEVIVDDRLFKSFRVPNGNILISPILINDNRVDVTVTPTLPGKAAVVTWRPESAAFGVKADVMTVAAGEETTVTLMSDTPGAGLVSGVIAADYTSGIPEIDSMVRTFGIEDPGSYARAVLIEALVAEGISVSADPGTDNPSDLLPAQGSYAEDTRVAVFVSPPYAEYAKLILKVSHNLGGEPEPDARRPRAGSYRS
jgi:D-alanyl-D-alanine carboxypeptidase/D-alanyl-D-alanine-endopeptidase (penicillin-binding protein 4)